MKGVNYSDKQEYKSMQLIKMQYNLSHHKSLFVNKHIFEESQTELHRHEYMQINYVAEGNGFCEFEDGTARFVQGSCFIIPPYVPHKIILGENVKKAEVFEVEFLTDFIFPPSHKLSDIEAYSDFICLGIGDDSKKEYSKHILNLEGKICEKVEQIIEDAMYEYQNREPGFETVLRSLILQLLTVLGRQYSLNSDELATDRYKKHRNEMLKVIDYIHSNYEKDITLESLSQLANYSSSYFCTLFKSATSKSYLEYLNHYRVKKSMELLKNTDKRVIDVALDVGFENVTNFNRVFKKLIGMSPTQYKKLK
ncbi:MAG: AraC family transcriptional regulator [Clostridia bacterium]|nr:AraC family transcriptional regulator [Clostridia bacterium]